MSLIHRFVRRTNTGIVTDQPRKCRACQATLRTGSGTIKEVLAARRSTPA
jgi:hypothetical protein